MATLSQTDQSSAPPVVGERVLIVEDDPATRVGLSELVGAWGFQTDEAANGEEALTKVTSFRPAIIVSDLVMPRMGGLELLRSLKDQLSDLTLILLTAQGTVESAVEAIKEGAYDYLSKPVDPARLRILLQKAVERQETLREVKQLRRQLREQGSFGRIIGNSPSIRSVYRIIEQAAPTNASVLIWGESGTGKELVAQTIHELSPRTSFPFVAINCAAIPETLLESEIFGHEKGAFTGAIGMRQGRFEMADGGTIFLDEIGDLTPDVQVKFLRVLQEGEFERVGSSRTRKIDVRVIAATHHDLEAAVAEGRFRADLYYRLSVYPIRLPSLRERVEDIPRLAWFFINRHQRDLGRRITEIPPRVIDALKEHSWPGNVRELENVIVRAMIESDGHVLQLDAPLTLTKRIAPAEGTPDHLDAVQRAHIETVLQRCGWRINGAGNAAECLGLHPNTLRFRMRKLGLVRPTA